MATKLLYMNDFDVTNCDAVVAMTKRLDDGRDAVVLDQTCFYPRGGGQDWDTGDIVSGQARLRVEEVRLDEASDVWHVGMYASGGLEKGDKVSCSVDQVRRDANTRLHSAGHLIDMAMTSIQPDWVAGKGAHYPHMSFVEYQVPTSSIYQDATAQILEVKLNELRNSPSRIVLYADDFGIPCGGTHVRQVSDIGPITITKLKIKKGVARVSYAVAGIN